MTRKTRYLAFGSAAFVLFGLCTGLVAYYGGIPSLTASRVGPAELAYVPSDTSIVAFADVRAVMNSELRQKLRPALPDDKKREELQRLTGIDIERDIDRVVAAVGADGEESTVAFVSGRFDASRIESLALQHGGEVVEYRGKRLVRRLGGRNHGADHKRPAQPDHDAAHKNTIVERHHDAGHPPALAFLEPTLLAFGSEASLRKAIDTQASGQDITDNTELMKIVSDVSSGNNVWAVGRMDSFISRMPREVAMRMPPVQWFAATGRVNGGINASLRAEARDDQAAENLRDVVRGGLALIKMQSNDPKFASLAQSIRLEGSGKTVGVSFAVPAEMIDLLVAHGPEGLVR